VAELTFVKYYPTTLSGVKNADIALGSVGIGIFVFGFLFYFFLRAYYLDYLAKKAIEGRASPFTTFRLVYFGNKGLNDL
jgi:hypothetical protein